MPSEESEVGEKGSDPPAQDCPSSSVSVESQYRNLCCELNLDSETTEEAWKSYISTRTNFTLEGDQLHWLACALYVACRRGILPTVGKGVHQGNGVSLTRLLRSTKLSLLQFFSKVRKWADMNHLSKEFHGKIDKLERNFSVSNVIFKKYQPIFVDLFKDPSDDPPKVNRSRKSKRPPCTPGELFDFCWTLFIRVKAAYPSISDDLVNSYHLLLATCDYVYCNAYLENREDLLNPNFMTQPVDDVERTNLCILDKLCLAHDGITHEVKTIREHFFREDIRKCIDAQKLCGHPESMMGILESSVFDQNFKNVRKDYEIHVLSIGEYDERVFLGEEANEEIGTPTKRIISSELEAGLIGRRNLQTAAYTSSTIVPNTPLSGRHYIKAKEEMLTTPVASVTYLVLCLNKSLSGRKDEPSPNLRSLITSLSPTAMETITNFVSKMSDIFIRQYNTPHEKPNSFAQDRLRKATALYYKLLENIIVDEQKKGKNVKSIIETMAFHETLYIACLEIVIFSYSSPTKCFPWALETFKVESFYFYKVIEILIRIEDGLARDVIKHLQNIEEKILEHMAFKSSSPFWTKLEEFEGNVPSSEQVSLPQGLSLHTGHSPVSHYKIGSFLQSPTPGDRFQSPTVVRQIFSSGTSSGTASVTNENIAPPPLPFPKNGSGLILFFRKVYNLAELRLDKMCRDFDLQEDLIRVAWTVFEFVMMNNIRVLKDRHLDQILMCVLYLVCKIRGEHKSFTDILSHYRKFQPQAENHVYRSVLLTPGTGSCKQDPDEDPPTAAPIQPPPTPSRMAFSSTVSKDGEVRGDLIKFFNSVFLELNGLKDFALQFGIKKASQPPMSPRPRLRATNNSPRKQVSERHNLYTRPLRREDTQHLQLSSPIKKLSYIVSKSPAKDLAAINEMMRNSTNSSKGIKRKLLGDDDEDASKRITTSSDVLTLSSSFKQPSLATDKA